VLPSTLAAQINRSTWRPLPIFDLITTTGNVARLESERTFNMGVGMVALVSAQDADAAIAFLQARGVPAWACGEVRVRHDGEIGDAVAKGGRGGAVTLLGDYQR